MVYNVAKHLSPQVISCLDKNKTSHFRVACIILSVLNVTNPKVIIFAN